MVSIEDAEFLRVKWHAHHSIKNTFYAFRTIHIKGSGKLGQNCERHSEYLHRLICPGDRVDHKNGDTLDNRRSNLRQATRSQNAVNSRKREHTTSIYRGVSWANSHKMWAVQIGGKLIGRFSSEKAAALAYNAAVVIKYGEFARLNEIP